VIFWWKEKPWSQTSRSMKAGFKMIDRYQSKHPFSPCLPPHDSSLSTWIFKEPHSQKFSSREAISFSLWYNHLMKFFIAFFLRKDRAGLKDRFHNWQYFYTTQKESNETEKWILDPADWHVYVSYWLMYFEARWTSVKSYFKTLQGGIHAEKRDKLIMVVRPLLREMHVNQPHSV